MCGSMVDIQSLTAEIRRGKKEEERQKPQGKNIMVCPITQGDHQKVQCFDVVGWEKEKEFMINACVTQFNVLIAPYSHCTRCMCYMHLLARWQLKTKMKLW